jgi:hypothetical protein
MGASTVVPLGGVGSALIGVEGATGIFGTTIDRAEGLYGSKTGAGGATDGGSLIDASGADTTGSGVGDLVVTIGGVAMRGGSTAGGGGTGGGGGMRTATR